MGAVQSHQRYVSVAMGACNKGDLNALRYAIRGGAFTSEFLGLLLAIAVLGGHENIVQELISAGAYLDGVRVEGILEELHDIAPLIPAAETGQVIIAQRLIAAGANMNIRSKGVTPLYIAAKNGHLEIVSQLIAKGAQVDATTHDGYAPLYVAAGKGRLGVVRKLVDSGASIDFKSCGFTALCVAAEKGHSAVVLELLTRGADVDARNKIGTTALQVAAWNGHAQVVLDLLAAGSDAELKDDEGDCAVNYALESQCSRTTDIVQAEQFKARLWRACLNGELTKSDLFRFLSNPQILTLQSLVIAHNILLIALRQGVVEADEVTSFRNDDDHLIYNVYYPLAKRAASLTPYENQLYRRVLQHAEQLRLIKPGQAFVVDVAVDIRMDIQRNRIEFSKVIEAIMHNLKILDERTLNLDQRITNIEEWARDASTRLNELDSRTSDLVGWTRWASLAFAGIFLSNGVMARNIVCLGMSLNLLHSLIQRKQRHGQHAAVAKLALACIPILGPSLGKSAISDIFLGLSPIDTVQKERETAVDGFFSVDLSNFQTVETLTSAPFLQSLDALTKLRFCTVIEQSKFNSVEGLRKSLAQVQQLVASSLPSQLGNRDLNVASAFRAIVSASSSAPTNRASDVEPADAKVSPSSSTPTNGQSDLVSASDTNVSPSSSAPTSRPCDQIPAEDSSFSSVQTDGYSDASSGLTNYMATVVSALLAIFVVQKLYAGLVTGFSFLPSITGSLMMRTLTIAIVVYGFLSDGLNGLLSSLIFTYIAHMWISAIFGRI